jgi:membrane protease YdiL (CAAX protease family)
LKNNRASIILLGWVTLLGFSGLGFALLYFFHDVAPLQLLLSGVPIWWQTGAGLAVGWIMGLMALRLLQHPYIQPAAERYEKLIASFELRPTDVVFISFCAGFGEEILFRGAVQLWLGVWLTAIVFVAIHGYLNPRNLRISVYGVFMTLAIALIGYLRMHLGIWSAISAHFAIDVVLLFAVLKKYEGRTE